MRAVLVLAIVLLAGCTDVPSGRSDTMRIHVIADGHWSIELPYPDDTLSQGALRDQLRISLGQGNITWQDGDLPLLVQGNGTLILESIARWDDPCCVFEFNQAQWSHGDMDNGRAPVHVLSGLVDQLSIDHSAVACQGVGCRDAARSAVQCSIETRLFARDLGPAMHELPTAPPIRTCQE